eukprot:6330755-Amphidinium_carterae.1
MDQLHDNINSRQKRLNDASNFLHYILLHTTKGKPNLLVRRLIRTSSGLETGDNSTPSMQVVIVIDRFNCFNGFFILSGQNHHQHSSQ